MASVLYTGLCVSMFEPWLGTLCCVLGQDTTLTVFLSPLSQGQKLVTSNLIMRVTL